MRIANFRWPPLDVSTGGGLDPQMTKFEQVSIDDHQLSVAGDRFHIWYLGEGVRPNASWAMTKQTPKKTLPSDNFVGG